MKQTKNVKRRPDTNGSRLGAADWLRAAQKELIAKGMQAVKVDRLARRMRVTRGSFYWHFSSHKDLLEKLLKMWVSTNTRPFERVLQAPLSAEAKFQAIVDLWISEDQYDPRFDAAVREWARVSAHVARVVRHADEARISVLQRIFVELGYVEPDALVRARIAYFHQVGYYTLGIAESAATRRRLRPYYTRALIGK